MSPLFGILASANKHLLQHFTLRTSNRLAAMTLAQACHQLTLARKRVAKAKKEIAHLHQVIARLGGDPQQKTKQQRDTMIYRRHLRGETYAEIAEDVQLSAHRVASICKRMDLQRRKSKRK